MKRHIIYIYALATLLLVGCNASRHRDMLAQLEELERQNVADSLMTNDSLAQALADYFDRHGTPNEQLRAHYILGRTYADMGEAPAAIEAYLDAATRADTTASDCDYAKLCRVYGQMADVFYHQNLFEDCIEAFHHSSENALKAHDTIYALNIMAHEIKTLGQLQEYDSVIPKFDCLYQEIKAIAGIETAAKYCLLPVKSLLERNNWEKAQYYLDIYEQYSGYFDSCHNIEKGRDVYYYYKGKYCLAVNKLDSAYYYFSKELNNTIDYLNQNMASYGLSVTFSLMHLADSAAKYALYSYDMNDSVYARMATKEVERAKAMYDYNRNKVLAEKKEKEAQQQKIRSERLLYLIFAVIVLTGFIIYRQRAKVRKGQAAILKTIDKLEQLEGDVVKLRTQSEKLNSIIEKKNNDLILKEEENDILHQHEESLKEMINKKEDEVEHYKQEFFELQRRYLPLKGSVEERLKKWEIYQKLGGMADKGLKLSSDELSLLHKMVIEVLPAFYQLISDKSYSLNEHEFDASILFRLHINAFSVGVMLGVSPSSVTKISKSLMKKLFQEEGTSKNLMEKLLEYC